MEVTQWHTQKGVKFVGLKRGILVISLFLFLHPILSYIYFLTSQLILDLQIQYIIITLHINFFF